ncbi:MAG: DEAD/DEAH box helicase [Gammaproteobacteria bacterium]|nr:DEAD/DEAH box helicase [Gammaproteobacteria bacterium]
MIDLRDYQAEIVTAIRQAYGQGYKAPLLVAPTGSGKTVLFSYIAHQAAARGNRTLILVHRQELLSQTARTLARFDVEHGLIAPGATLTDDLVQVASVQTLVRRLDRLAWQPTLIVADEAHHCTADTGHGRIVAHYDKAKVLGVTATPERLDGKGLGLSAGGFFDCLIEGPTVAALVEQGHLSRPVVYAPASKLDLSGIRTLAGDFDKGALAAAMDRPTITGDAVAHYRRFCDGKPSIAFCVSVAHAEHVAEAFRLAGYQATSIDGTLDDRTRRQRIEDLGSGRLHVLTSCELIGEGVDVPIVGGAILLRPTQSVALNMQQIGRALRIHEGKEKAVIIDAVGNVLRHGHPLEDRQWSLDSKPRRQRKAQEQEDGERVKVCPECSASHGPAPSCPECGYEYPQARRIEAVEGELAEIKPGDRRLALKREQAQCKTLAELRELGRAHGYREGWADAIWRYRQDRHDRWKNSRWRSSN